jgi:hypothetical protein
LGPIPNPQSPIPINNIFNISSSDIIYYIHNMLK